MTGDFENAINPDLMTDGDIRRIVLRRLDEDPDFDVDSVEVSVEDGRITVAGRVGTEGERQHVGQVVASLGVTELTNEVVVDEARRARRDPAADVARIEDARADAAIGESGKSTSDTAEHLRPGQPGDLRGTRDVKEAIQEGKTYTPPEGPVQEGIDGGERH